MDNNKESYKQEEVKDREKKFSVLLANLPGMVYECNNDENWTMTFVSEGCEQLTGYTSDELINSEDISYGSLIDIEYREFVWEQVQESLNRKRPFQIEYKIITKDKEVKWVWEQGQGLFNEEGKLVNIQGFITDITENKRMEERLKTENRWLASLIENSSDPVVCIDQNHKVLDINQRFEEVFKYSLEEMKGKDLDDIMDTEKKSTIDRDATKKLLNGIKVVLEDTRYNKYGKPIDCIIKGIPVVVDNEFVGAYAIYMDVTEQKEREKELKDKNKKLQQSYEELTVYNEEVQAMNEELDESIQKINQLNERFVNMINVVSNLDKSSSGKDNRFLTDLLATAINIVPEADYGKIYVMDEDGKFRFINAVGHNIDLLKKISIDKDMIFNLNDRVIHSSNDSSFDIAGLPADQRKVIQEALKPVSRSIYVNIRIDGEFTGRITLDIASGTDREFSMVTERLLESFASLAAAFFSFTRYNKLQSQFTNELISGIVQIMEIYDSYTKGHSENVARLGMKIAKNLDLSEQEIEATYWAGMVHDIGKLLVPQDILNKEGSLTDQEYDLMKKHPYWSFMVLSKSGNLKNIAKYVLHHHERWDGKGYPDGLEGDNIPLVSQILAVVDAWDAMTSHRAYRAPLSVEEALREMKENKGTQFSPEIVNIFLDKGN